MEPLSIVIMVVSIVTGVAIINVVIWRVLRGKIAKLPPLLLAELQAMGEHVVIAPEPGIYRGGTGSFSRVKSIGAIALTRSRVVFRGAFGSQVDVPLPQVAGLREDKWFLRAYRGGRLHLIVRTVAGDEVGFFVKDHEAWKGALQKIIGKGASTTPTP